MKKHNHSFAALLLGALLPVSVWADASSASGHSPFGLGIEVGTTGVGPVIQFTPNANFDLTLSYNFFSYDEDNLRGRDSRYDADIDLSTVLLAASWHPLKNGFHVTAGAALVDHEFEITARPRGGSFFEIGDNDYDRTQITSLTGDIQNDQDIVPYIGAGWNFTFGNSGFTLITHAGVLISDDYKVGLTASGPSAGDPVLQADLRKEERDVADELSVYPVIKIGFVYRF